MATQKKRLRAQVTVGHDADGTAIYKWANSSTPLATHIFTAIILNKLACN